MGGVGVSAWLAIGVAAGWVIGRLMMGAEDDALRGTTGVVCKPSARERARGQRLG